MGMRRRRHLSMTSSGRSSTTCYNDRSLHSPIELSEETVLAISYVRLSARLITLAWDFISSRNIDLRFWSTRSSSLHAMVVTSLTKLKARVNYRFSLSPGGCSLICSRSVFGSTGGSLSEGCAGGSLSEGCPGVTLGVLSTELQERSSSYLIAFKVSVNGICARN